MSTNAEKCGKVWALDEVIENKWTRIVRQQNCNWNFDCKNLLKINQYEKFFKVKKKRSSANLLCVERYLTIKFDYSPFQCYFLCPKMKYIYISGKSWNFYIEKWSRKSCCYALEGVRSVPQKGNWLPNGIEFIIFPNVYKKNKIRYWVLILRLLFNSIQGRF